MDIIIYLLFLNALYKFAFFVFDLIYKLRFINFL